MDKSLAFPTGGLCNRDRRCSRGVHGRARLQKRRAFLSCPAPPIEGGEKNRERGAATFVPVGAQDNPLQASARTAQGGHGESASWWGQSWHASLRVGQAQGEVCGEAEAGGGECGGMRGWGLLALGLSGSAAGALLTSRAAAE